VSLPDLATATVADLRTLLESGEVTSRDLVSAHLDRISRYDKVFGAIRCLAPDALEQADASDRVRREQGARSPIEGIPVLLKDNIDVAGLPTTAGALALQHSTPTVDAALVTRLKEAGAVVLGKTNLSELANFLTEDMPSGYSSLGGQVLNAYDISVTPSGSSSGSGVAATLGYAPLTVGTETDGSITSPADCQSLVGYKPTLGLVSRTGILPIAPSQDTAGPMTRTVADAAALLAVIAGPDPADSATAPSGGVADALQNLVLDVKHLRGARIAVVTGEMLVPAAAIDALRHAGASLVDTTMPEDGHDDELTVLHYEFAPAVDSYLAALGPAAPMKSLADIRAFNRANVTAALKFGQIHVDTAVAVDHIAQYETYRQARARDLAFVTESLVAALADNEFLAFPGASGCSWAARAGWPSIVIPIGYAEDNRRPIGLMLVGRPWSDARLLQIAYAAEQAYPVRRTPFEVNPAIFRSL
jgi:amidase